MNRTFAKALFAMFLAVLIAVSCVPVYVLATDTQAITAETVKVFDTEKTATVAVSLSGNPGVTSLRLHVSYDVEAMTLVEVKDGGILGTANHPGKLSIYPYILSWTNDTATSDITANGTIATLKFELKDNIEPGEYEVSVSYDNDNDDILNFDLNTVEFKVNPGKIIVEFTPINVTAVSLNKKSVSLARNKSEVLIATVSPNNATDKSVIWESDNEAVATVDDNGMVTAIGDGVATITVKTADGNFSDSCTVTVYCSHSNKADFPAVKSTCESKGNKLYYVCDDCGKVFKADGVTPTTVENETLPFADHIYVYVKEDPATHFAPGMKSHYSCDVCKKIFDLDRKEITDDSILRIPKILHSYGDWKSNDTNHWHECGCGNIIDKASHDFVWVTDKNAAEESTGIKHEECTVCGFSRNEGTVIPAHPHTHSMVPIPAKNATCTTEGNIAYWHCEKCNKYYLDSEGNAETALADTVIAKSKHNYIEKCDAKYIKSIATCIDKAVYFKSCSECGEKSAETFEYGKINSDNHIGGTYLKNEKAATCYEEGYTGDTFCAGCDAKLSSGRAIGKIAHNPDSVWSADETNHWKVCLNLGCGDSLYKAKHCGGEATCTNKAVCEVCGIRYGDTDTNNHKNTEIRNAKAATCSEAGYTGDIYCTDCNKKLSSGRAIGKIAHNPDSVWSADETNHWKVCLNLGCGDSLYKAKHCGGEATCTDKAVCEVCGIRYGDIDTNNHKNTEIRNAKEATCLESGYTGDIYCVDCNTKLADGKEIQQKEHSLERVAAKEATHYDSGNIEYFKCSNCDKLFKDSEAKTEITAGETTIAKGEHNYTDDYKTDSENHWKECNCGSKIEVSRHDFGSWNTVKEATNDEKGFKKRTCTVCGYADTEDIPATGATTKPTDDAVPNTGDDSISILWVALFIISASGVVGLAIADRKKKKIKFDF